MLDIGRVARADDGEIYATLSEKERAALWPMLSRIADAFPSPPSVLRSPTTTRSCPHALASIGPGGVRARTQRSGCSRPPSP